MGQAFADQRTLKTGDAFTIDGIPGAGSLTTVRAAVQGDPIKEVALFNALVHVRLGPWPADYKLKGALLGHKS